MSAPTQTKLPIAIVGISLEIPSGHHSTENLNHDTFYEHLLAGKESYEPLPPSRFDTRGYVGEGLGRIISDSGCFLKGLDQFDYTEFGVNAKDALAMAVSTRKLLEHSFLALRDSGIDYRGKDIGFYGSGVAVATDSFSDPNRTEYDAHGSFAGSPSMVANKISYHLDLRGPSVPVDTACSSTMTATHLAIQAIRAGDCTAAVVGGAQVNHKFVDFVHYAQGHLLSPEGKCKPFDANANGFARGEGVGAFVLKPLHQALLDIDKIYATILGTGLNATGSVGPVHAPVASAQENAMDRAFVGTGYQPLDIDYFELHATGTAAGDPTEANWAGKKLTREDGILVGSAKGNIGHLEIASFLAALSKVCSILEHKVVPPTVNVTTLNPAIHWKEYDLRVPTVPTELPLRSRSRKALASISNYGIGGVNGHALIEEAPASRLNTFAEENPEEYLLVCGGLTPRSATAVARDLSKLLKSGQYKADMGDLAYAYARQSRSMTWKTYFMVDQVGRPTSMPREPQMAPKTRPPCIFVFSGQGPQHIAMGRELFQSSKVFRESIIEMDKTYKQSTGFSILTDNGLFDKPIQNCSIPDQWPISLTIPAIAMVQMAIVDVLRDAGVTPDAIVGHSAGETAMLYAAGCASKAFVVEVAVARGRAMLLMEMHNLSMAAVSCSRSKCEEILDELRQENPSLAVDIACQNAPEAVAVSGDANDLDAVVSKAKAFGFSATKLRTKVAVHSAKMVICEAAYREFVGAVFAKHGPLPKPLIPTWSTLYGRRMNDAFTAEYFWDSARGAVLFDVTINDVFTQYPGATFVELSPHPVLSSYISMMSVPASSICSAMRRLSKTQPSSELRTFLSLLGTLAVNGVPVDWNSVTRTRYGDPRSVKLPTYPFAKAIIPYLPPGMTTDCKPRRGPLNFPDLHLSADTHPELAQHVINKEPIMPAAAFLEMAFETGARVIRDVEFTGILPLLSDGLLKVDVSVDTENNFTVKSYSPSMNSKPRLHVRGVVEASSEAIASKLDLSAIKNRCKELDISQFHDIVKQFADYGPLFQRVQNYYLGHREALTRLTGISKTENTSRYIVHPAVLDSAFHNLIHPDFICIPIGNDYFLPSKFKSVVLHPAWNPDHPPEILFSHATFKQWRPDSIICDFVIADVDGSILVTIEDFEVARHERVSLDQLPLNSDDLLYEPTEDYVDIDSPLSLPTGAYASKFSPEQVKDIQTVLKSRPDIFWLYAMDDVEGAASCGFFRVLKREQLSQKMRLVLFDPSIPTDLHQGILGSLATIPDLEDEIRVDSRGRIHIPRVRPVVRRDELAPSMRELLAQGCVLRSDRTYMLVGGLGSLGLKVACWMYERGARSIVLTSKSGRDSLFRRRTEADRRTLDYLESLSDMDLRLHATDATSVRDMTCLISSTPYPIAGILLMSNILSDNFFLAHDQESFIVPYPPKVSAFRVIEACVSIAALDFFVPFSSIASFGNPGQSNYASANSQMDKMVERYPNAFSLILPAIYDSHTITDDLEGRYDRWRSCSMSSREVCLALEDGITKLQAGFKFQKHIPPLKWNDLTANVGPDTIWNHMLTVEAEDEGVSIDESLLRLSGIVQKILGVDADDLDDRIPFTSYGLDSLSAGRLSFALRPLMNVTQLQLLADLALNDLEVMLKKAFAEKVSANQ